jgi:sulfur carrier protein
MDPMDHPAEWIDIVVNGEAHQVRPGETVLKLLTGLGQDPRTVAVEHNGEILRRRHLGETRLRNGDHLEIVHFVQGGAGSGRRGRPERLEHAETGRGGYGTAGHRASRGCEWPDRWVY